MYKLLSNRIQSLDIEYSYLLHRTFCPMGNVQFALSSWLEFLYKTQELHPLADGIEFVALLRSQAPSGAPRLGNVGIRVLELGCDAYHARS